MDNLQDSLASDEAIKTINVHLEISCLKIEEVSQQSDDIESVCKLYRLNSLAPFGNFRELLEAIRDWRSLARCISITIRFYIIIKLCYLSAVLFKFDLAREKISRSAFTGAANSRLGPKCIDYPNHDGPSTINPELKDALFSQGSLLHTFHGVVPLSLVLAASTSVCFDFLGPFVISFGQIKMDIYGFIKDKHAERRRFSRNIKMLVEDLFICQGQANSVGGQGFYKYTSKGNSFIVRAYLLAFRRSGGGNFNRHLMVKMNQLVDSTKNCLFILGDKQLHELVEPAHLKDRWHRQLCYSFRKLTHIGLFMCFGFGKFFLTSMTVIEIVRRVDYRLLLTQCLNENKSLSAQFAFPLQLRELETESQLAAYENHDGSFANFLELFFIEYRLYYGWREMFTYCMLVHVILIGSFSIALYQGIYIAQHVSRTLWFNQIRQQVKGCIASLIGAYKSNVPRDREETKNNNIRLLTLAYLNFESFRREQRAHQSMTNFLVAQMFLMIIPLVITTYLTLNILSESDRLVMFSFICYTFSLLDVYLITSAIKTNTALKLMKELSRLLAYITESNLEQSLIARLWSSQILNYNQTLSCFAPKLLGISISFDKIVNLNVYMLALWILSLRS